MKNIQEYEKGNFADYQGPQGGYKFCEIQNIEQGETSIHYTLQTQIKLSVFIGRRDNLVGIKLEPEHLKLMGFTLKKETGIYEFYHTSIGYHNYTIQHDEDHITRVIASMRIYPPQEFVPQTKDQINADTILNNTIPIVCVHWFQNYCNEIGLKFDFSVLQSFQR